MGVEVPELGAVVLSPPHAVKNKATPTSSLYRCITSSQDQEITWVQCREGRQTAGQYREAHQTTSLRFFATSSMARQTHPPAEPPRKPPSSPSEPLGAPVEAPVASLGGPPEASEEALGAPRRPPGRQHALRPTSRKPPEQPREQTDWKLHWFERTRNSAGPGSGQPKKLRICLQM